jgi:hypothetical protein
MNSTSLLATFSVTCLLGIASAQVQIPINPKATYLGISNDPAALPAPGIPLSALGVSPGQWLSISTVGAFSGNGSSDTMRNLVCVFSSTSQLLTATPGLLNRVPGAIQAGADYVTNNTYYGPHPTDIPQDFVVTRNQWANGTLVKVPAGANFLFFSVYGTVNYTFFGSNTDANSDYFAVFTVVTPSALHGTQEHVELLSAVSGTPTLTPEVKPAAPFTTVSTELAQRWGVSSNEIWALAANIYTTGGAPPIGPLPDLHVGANALIVQVGVMTSTPGLWSFFIPPGHPGTTLILQGILLDTQSRNGLLMSTNAHRIELQ